MSNKFSLAMITEATKGQLVQEGATSFSGVGTDTRNDLSGQLFIALKGDSFDAHKFLRQAVNQGASGLMVHEMPDDIGSLGANVTIVKVDDTLKALQQVAHAWRTHFSAKVLSITGSNGKTTTKGFLATILSSQFKTTASPGSFNNHWGVPLSLLSVEPDDAMAVIEMGMNHAGELTALAAIAEPDVVVVTNVGRSHIGFFGTEEKIAEAKAELYESSPNAIQVFNLDNSYTYTMYEQAKKILPPDKLMTFSAFTSNVDVSLRVTETDLDFIKVTGQIGGVSGEAVVPVFGRQNVNNLMAASCMALAVGMSGEKIWQSLPNCKTGWGRNQVIELRNGARVLFDAYNANPESMAALIKNIFEIPSRRLKVMVLGEMLELGEQTEALHEQLGEMVGNTDVDLVWFIGPSQEAFELGIERGDIKKTLYLSDTYEEKLAMKIASMIDSQDIIVIKGSRGIKLEQVLRAWEPKDF